MQSTTAKSLEQHLRLARAIVRKNDPCRGIRDLTASGHLKNIEIDCLDMDENTIGYAQNLLSEHSNIQFIQKIFSNLRLLKTTI